MSTSRLFLSALFTAILTVVSTSVLAQHSQYSIGLNTEVPLLSATGATVLKVAVNETTAEETKLLAVLASAGSETEGRYAEDSLWRFWFDESPTPEIRASLDAGIERRGAYDYEAAEMHFDAVVASAPDYAEGYNQRAFIRFLRENYEEAEQDLKKAMELKPKHFGVLAGFFHVYTKLNNQESAYVFLQEAMRLHPWIKERFALPKSLWPESYRRIHEPGTEI